MEMKRTFDVRIGTCGWSYPHWQGPFYPFDLPPAQRLNYYATRLHSVEIDNSFYRLPERRMFVHWAASVPEHFLFTVKASRYITHMKKLMQPRISSRAFFRHVAPLGTHLGPILFQLPPRWKADPRRLLAFLQALSSDFRYAFEFRDISWIDENIFEILNRHRAAFCIYELDGYLTPKVVTTDFIYVRLHGPGGPYRGSYSPHALAAWATLIAGWREQGKNVYCYFDNDHHAYAPLNAESLRTLVESGAFPQKAKSKGRVASGSDVT